MFSYLVLSILVQEVNAWNLIGTETWRDKTLGWRVKTARFIASAVGRAEADPVPADVDGTYVELTPTIKETLVATALSIRMVESAAIADVITENQYVMEFARDVLFAQNADLLAALATVEGDNVEALRNLLSSYDELTAKSLAADSIDPWGSGSGADRDAAASAFDANALYDASADRDLRLDLIDTLRENQEPFWDNKLSNKAYLTRYDTWRRWGQLEEAKERIGTEMVEMTVNGVRSARGKDVGTPIAAYEGVIVARDDNMFSDGTVGAIALLDLDHIFKAQLRPFETVSSDELFVVGTNSRTAMYAIHEILDTKFGAHGVLDNLQ